MDEQNCKDLPMKGIPQEPDAPANDTAQPVQETTEIVETAAVPEASAGETPAEETTADTPAAEETPEEEPATETPAPEETEEETLPTEETPLPESPFKEIPVTEPTEEPTTEPATEKPAAGEDPVIPSTEPDSPTPPPPYDPQSDLAALMERTGEMARRLAAMEELFTKRIMYTDHEEKTLDRMHSELQRYKEDLYFKLIKPILVDVLEMRDSITRMTEMYAAKPEGQQDIPLKTFANYAYDLQEILEKNGIEIFRSEPGGDYVPLRQRVVKKVKTTEEALHGKVAQSITSGYMNGDKVLSPEKVSVYLYEAPKED